MSIKDVQAKDLHVFSLFIEMAKVGANWKKLQKTLPVAPKKAPNPNDSLEKEETVKLVSKKQKMSIQNDKYTKNNDRIGKYVAIDCEMVGVGSMGATSVLARVSLVNYHGSIILDEYVLPQEHVVDYRTHVSGITPKLLLEKGKPFKQVQKTVSDLLKNKIIVGHALKNDLQALMLDHPKPLLRDTSLHKPFRNPVTKRPRSLRDLALAHLNKVIQQGEHSSVEDARCALELFKLFKSEWESALYLNSVDRTGKKVQD